MSVLPWLKTRVATVPLTTALSNAMTFEFALTTFLALTDKSPRQDQRGRPFADSFCQVRFQMYIIKSISND